MRCFVCGNEVFDTYNGTEECEYCHSILIGPETEEEKEQGEKVPEK